MIYGRAGERSHMNIHNKNREIKPGMRLLWAVVGYLCIIVTMAIGMAILISKETIPMESVFAVSMAGVFLSSLLVHAVLVIRLSSKIIQHVGLSVASVIGITIAVSILFCGGISAEGWGIAAMIFLGGVVSVVGKLLIPAKSKHKKYRSS